jgi:DNA-binding FadR family transcriptional regulator
MKEVASLGDRPNVRVPKTAELVAGHIRRQVVTRQLHDGDALPTETSLMEQFGISRPTLREAFRILESEGLITVRRGARGGARIQEPSTEVAAVYSGLVLQHRNTTVADVLAARTLVEAPAARMLAERPDRDAIVERLQHELEHTSIDPDEFDRFNHVIVELTENQTLILISAIIAGIARAAALRYSVDDDRRDQLVRRAMRTRQQVIDFIAAGDGDHAEDLWRRYLTEAGDVLAAGTGATVVDLFS